MRPRTCDDFQIAIICALTLEADAVEALFDEPYDKFGSVFPKQSGDQNTYITGRIGSYNVVLCYLPGMGIGSAASAAAYLRVSYEQVKLALLVGICGAVPFLSNNDEVVLGDIIISDSVIHYDFDIQYVKETLGRPSQEIRGFLAALRGRKTRSYLQEQTYKYLQTLQTPSEAEWQYPGTEHDVLYDASYRHKHYRQNADTTCTTCSNCKSSDDPVCDEALKEDCKRLGCDASSIQRSRLSADSVQPRVHIGKIASANTVMKSGEHRDKLAETKNVIGFEMEGAGVWDNLPCIIVKGVCDYADSHKNKKWQNYAAATAASCAKAFLETWPVTTTKSLKSTTFVLPFERNKDFVGRESQLQELEEGLFVDGRFTKMALFALGGMGKTSIALELIYRIIDKYPSCSVFWVISTSSKSFEQSYLKIGQKLNLPGLEDKATDVKKIVTDYLNDEESGQWFIIYDNADDFDAWYKRPEVGSSRRLADYVPSNTRGCTLLTTRNEKVAISFARRSVLKVSEMDKETSIRLLGKTLGEEEALVSDDDANNLLMKLCFIPLAIVQAGAYMTLNHATIPEYLSILDETEESLVETLSEDFEDDRRYQDQKNPIVTTWIESFLQIKRQSSLAAQYLSFISCIAPKAIPQSLLPPASSKKEQLEAIACLKSYSFLSKQVDGSLDMHQLVHIVTRYWLKESQSYEDTYRLIISRLTQVFPTDNPANRSVWRTYFPHVEFTLSLNQMQIPIHYHLLSRYGQCLLSDGRYFEAESPLADVVKATKQQLGAEHLDTLNDMCRLATAYDEQGRWREVKKLFLQDRK